MTMTQDQINEFYKRLETRGLEEVERNLAQGNIFNPEKAGLARLWLSEAEARKTKEIQEKNEKGKPYNGARNFINEYLKPVGIAVIGGLIILVIGNYFGFQN